MGIFSSLGSFAGQLFGDYKDPTAEANKYYQQIPGTIKPYYQPYISAGTGALGDLQTQYRQMLSDPTAIMSQFGSKFQASPGYAYNVSEATRGANQAAAAGGMLGSPAEQAALAGRISGLASQDYNSFLANALGLYGQGLGVAGDINRMGYGASNELAQSLANNLLTQGQGAYAGAVGANQRAGSLWGSAGDVLDQFNPFFGGTASSNRNNYQQYNPMYDLPATDFMY